MRQYQVGDFRRPPGRHLAVTRVGGVPGVDGIKQQDARVFAPAELLMHPLQPVEAYLVQVYRRAAEVHRAVLCDRAWH